MMAVALEQMLSELAVVVLFLFRPAAQSLKEQLYTELMGCLLIHQRVLASATPPPQIAEEQLLSEQALQIGYPLLVGSLVLSPVGVVPPAAQVPAQDLLASGR